MFIFLILVNLFYSCTYKYVEAGWDIKRIRAKYLKMP